MCTRISLNSYIFLFLFSICLSIAWPQHKRINDSPKIHKNLEDANSIEFAIPQEVIINSGSPYDLIVTNTKKYPVSLGIFNEKYLFSISLTDTLDSYFVQNDNASVLAYAHTQLVIANSKGIKDPISKANFRLSKLYESIGNYKAAYHYYRQHIVYRDSIKYTSDVEQISNKQDKNEIIQKQLEVDLLNQQKQTQKIIVIATAVALFLILLLALGLFLRNRYINRTNLTIKQERDRAENLLLNILPEDTALELKLNGKVVAKKIDSATVLFTDFKGFTQFSEHLSPETLVETIGYYFSKFDDIIEKHGLEKIKTMGDSYMCAGGLHSCKKDHAQKMVMAACEMAEFVDLTKRNESNTKNFEIRIGINSGPVVAGVVGNKKFAYDIWGDTVNVASHMENMSELGKINISKNTHELICNEFDCEYRGEFEVKNRGMMKLYFIKGSKIKNRKLEYLDVAL